MTTTHARGGGGVGGGGERSSSSSSSAATATGRRRNYDFEEEEEGGGAGLFLKAGGGSDPLTEWIEERQRAFRDFERSFQQPKQLFHHSSPLLPPPLPLEPPSSFSRRLPPLEAPPQHQHIFGDGVIPEEDEEEEEDGHDEGEKMLSRNHHPDLDRDLSPKARVTYDEGRFQVEFDVRDYRPEELSIKTEGDVLIVLAKHETKTEGGGSFVSRQFEQRFTLPSGVKPESITSSLAKDGTLTVTAPREHR